MRKKPSIDTIPVNDAIFDHYKNLQEQAFFKTFNKALSTMGENGEWDKNITPKINDFLDNALDFYQQKEFDLFKTQPEFHKKNIFSLIVQPEINNALEQIGIHFYSNKINEGKNAEQAKMETRDALQAHINSLPSHEWKKSKDDKIDQTQWADASDQAFSRIPPDFMDTIISTANEKIAKEHAEAAESEKRVQATYKAQAEAETRAQQTALELQAQVDAAKAALKEQMKPLDNLKTELVGLFDKTISIEDKIQLGNFIRKTDGLHSEIENATRLSETALIAKKIETHIDNTNKWVESLPPELVSRTRRSPTSSTDSSVSAEDWVHADLDPKERAEYAVQRDLKDCSPKQREHISIEKNMILATDNSSYIPDPSKATSTANLITLKTEAINANIEAKKDLSKESAALEKELLYQKALHLTRIDAKEKQPSSPFSIIFKQPYANDRKELTQINLMLNKIDSDKYPLLDTKSTDPIDKTAFKKGSELSKIHERFESAMQSKAEPTFQPKR